MATIYRFKPADYSSHAAILSALPAEGRGRRVLDLGCAGGYLSSILADRGYEVTGVERPFGAGSDFPQNVRLIEADLNDPLPETGQVYSYIICADILEHLREPVRLLRQLPPLLATGGRVIASLPNSGNLYFRVNTIGGRLPQHDRGLFDRTHIHFFKWPEWVRLLDNGGFEVESVRPTGIPVGLALPKWEHSWPVHLAERLCYDLGRAWMSLFAYQFVVSARPRSSS